MNYNESLQEIVTYIEDNLTRDLLVEEVAKQIGFSIAHFQRLFQEYMKMTFHHYMTRRKLLHAIYEMDQGDKIVAVALRYGFETYAGFYKAFKKEYGCSPRTYLQSIKIEAPQPVDVYQQTFKRFSISELKEILTHWDLPKKIKIETQEIKGRWVVNDQYVLRCSTNLKAIEKITILSKVLTKQGLVVPKLIPLSQGGVAVCYEAMYFYLEPKLQQNNSPLPITYEKLGQEIGQVHEVFLNQVKSNLYPEVDLYQIIAHWAIPKIQEWMKTWERQLPEHFLKEYLTQFERNYSQLPKQMIHRKMSVNHLLINADGLIGITHLEQSEYNSRLVDVCYLGTSLLSQSMGEEWIDDFNQLVRGYQTVNPLTEMEKEAIIEMLYAIQFLFIAYLKDKYECRALLQMNIEQLFFIYDHRDQLEFK